MQGLTLKQLVLDLNPTESEGNVNKRDLHGLLVVLYRCKKIDDMMLLPIHGRDTLPDGPSRRLHVLNALQY